MGVRKLDRDRYYAIVYGDPKRKFMQDSVFFNGAGIAVDDAGKKKPEPVQTNDPPAVMETDDSEANKLKQLTAMSVPALKKLAKRVSEQTETNLPAGGQGAKARLVAYIAKHTD